MKNLWKNYKDAVVETFPDLSFRECWASWEGKKLFLTAETYVHPYFIKRLVDWADIIRKTFYDGGIEDIISTRRLVHIIRAYSIFKNKAKAIQVCINRFDDETKQSFMELYDKVDADFEMPETNEEKEN